MKKLGILLCVCIALCHTSCEKDNTLDVYKGIVGYTFVGELEGENASVAFYTDYTCQVVKGHDETVYTDLVYAASGTDVTIYYSTSETWPTDKRGRPFLGGTYDFERKAIIIMGNAFYRQEKE